MRSRLRSRHRSAVRPSATLRAALLGGALLLGLGAATEASAQYVYGYARGYPGPAYDDVPPMPPRAIVFRLYDRGFTEIGRPRFDGTAYVVDATRPAGDRIRLFLDPRDGGVVGRQRLDAPYYPSGRMARGAPGYGWTEEDGPRRRNAERLIPPADIPLPRPSLHGEAERGPAPGRTAAVAPGREGGPFGLNPDAAGRVDARSDKADAKGRGTAKDRRTAKLAPPAKPAAPNAVPPAPTPQASPEQAAKQVPDAGDGAKATAKAEEPKTAPAPLLPAAQTPPAREQAAEKPAAADKPADARAEAASEPRPEAKAAEKPAANQEWHDPPADGQKRNVRVIGGATLVPGNNGAEAPASGAN